MCFKGVRGVYVFLMINLRYFPTLQALDLAKNNLEHQLGEDRGDRDVVWPHKERRSTSVERRSSSVAPSNGAPRPRLPRARSEPRNTPKLGWQWVLAALAQWGQSVKQSWFAPSDDYRLQQLGDLWIVFFSFFGEVADEANTSQQRDHLLFFFRRGWGSK